VSAGDGLALNWLAMARNGGGLQVYPGTNICLWLSLGTAENHGKKW